jgi:cell division protein FtsB
MDGNFATLIEQLAQQQRIISQLRNENRELKDKNSHLVRKLTLLEVQQPIQAMRPRKQIFSSHSSPIKFLNVPK